MAGQPVCAPARHNDSRGLVRVSHVASIMGSALAQQQVECEAPAAMGQARLQNATHSSDPNGHVCSVPSSSAPYKRA